MAIPRLCIFLCIFAGLHAQTTSHLQEVFLGKCYDRNPVGTNCSLLWSLFSSAAALDNTVVSNANYAPFFEVANFSTGPNRALFWSGNMAFALAVASNDPRYVTVEETSTGYVMNSLVWCGAPGAQPPAFDYVGPCPYPSNDTYYGMQGVWSTTSALFAQGASGNISVLLEPQPQYRNSGVYQAYRNTSIFSQIEIPNMDTSKIQSMSILLLKNPTKAPDEVCGQGSLLVLQNEIYQKFGFNSTCVDEPGDIYDLFCPDGTSSAQCLAATLVYTRALVASPEIEDDRPWAIATTVLMAVFVLITLVLAALLIRKGIIQ